MKTLVMKNKLITLTILLLFIGSMLGCSDDDNGNNGEYPREQTATINLFEDNTATVKGFLTDTEWAGVADKIETAINAAFDAGNLPAQNRFRNIFNNPATEDKVTIFVDNNADYESYKVGNKMILHLNFDYLSMVLNADLQTAITAAVREMNDLPMPPLAKSRIHDVSSDPLKKH